MRQILVMTCFTVATATLAGGFGNAAHAETLSWRDLTARMTDLEALSRLPHPQESSAMWSSYDRASQYNPSDDRYIAWAANLDGDGFIRKDGDDIVMAEMTGPGVVWRIWSAEVRTGNIRIYIDDQPEPVIDMPFGQLFTGQHAPFDYPALSYETPITPGEFADRGNLGGGRNLYFPIPYRKSCRIVATPNWGRYFQITYTTFPPGTQVPSFTRELPAEATAALRELNDRLSQRLGENPAAPREGQETLTKTVTAQPGQRAAVAKLSGARAITALRVRVPDWDRATQMQALRRLVLQIRWDGQDKPAVWAPLGDFFAIAPYLNDYKTLISGVRGNELYSYWFMPFAGDATIELINEDDAAHELEFEITHAPLAGGFDGRGHFHAKWHRGGYHEREDRWPDWLVLDTRGRGRFVGMHLHVWNPRYGSAPEEIAAPGHYWWGEGDEKFHVDGEKFPSTFGTGTEDYFGYAWCDPAYFAFAFHAQPVTESNAGHQSLVRYQVAENVPFQQSFQAWMEKYFPDDYPSRFAVLAYWYQAPGGRDVHEPVPVEQRHSYYDRPEITAGGYRAVPGAGVVTTQDMRPFRTGRWHNGDQLWWTQAKVGDRLDIMVPVEQAGRHQVEVTLTQSFDYAIVQLYLNGEKAGEPIDLFSPAVTRSEPIDLGVHELDAGDAVLTVEIVGANPRAQPGHMFGLDEVIVRRR